MPRPEQRRRRTRGTPSTRTARRSREPRQDSSVLAPHDGQGGVAVGFALRASGSPAHPEAAELTTPAGGCRGSRRWGALASGSVATCAVAAGARPRRCLARRALAAASPSGRAEPGYEDRGCVRGASDARLTSSCEDPDGARQPGAPAGAPATAAGLAAHAGRGPRAGSGPSLALSRTDRDGPAPGRLTAAAPGCRGARGDAVESDWRPPRVVADAAPLLGLPRRPAPGGRRAPH